MAAHKEIICHCPYDFANMRTNHEPPCELATVEHAPEVMAQIEGQPLAPVEFVETRNSFEQELSRLVNFHSMEQNTPDFLLAEFLAKARVLFVETTEKRDRWKNDNATVANFGFYVDGFTLHSTDSIEEIRVVSFDGRETLFPTKQLVAFLERRLSPPNIMPEN